jgi:hypothetical protein
MDWGGGGTRRRWFEGPKSRTEVRGDKQAIRGGAMVRCILGLRDMDVGTVGGMAKVRSPYSEQDCHCTYWDWERVREVLQKLVRVRGVCNPQRVWWTENGWIYGCMISVTGLRKRVMC